MMDVVLVLSQEFSNVEEKKAFLALFALRFPGLVEYLKEDSERQGTPDLRVEFELGSYEIGDKYVEVTFDGDTYYSLHDLSESCNLQLLDYGRDPESPDLEIEASSGKITKYECYEWTVHDVSNFNGEEKIKTKDASPDFHKTC
jgi:hypothetical protein